MPGRLVVIGGDAGGMAAATNARRQDDDLEIVALEKGTWTSYSACGIPYLIGGVVTGGVETLVARTPQQFRSDHRIDVRIRHEAMAIDLEAGKPTTHLGKALAVATEVGLRPLDLMAENRDDSALLPDLIDDTEEPSRG